MTMSKQTAPETEGGFSSFLKLVGTILALGLLGGGYFYLDDTLFATHRPWNLLLFVIELGVGVLGVVFWVNVLIRMCRSEKDRPLGLVVALLTPVLGLGYVLAFVWGWNESRRDDHTDAKQRESVTGLMQYWTACLVIQLAIAGYVWYNRAPDYVPGVVCTKLDHGQVNCADCGGSGQVNCSGCSGSGHYTTYVSSGYGAGQVSRYTQHECGLCCGSGRRRCTACGGTGKR
jgi:hypothetical protein